MPGEPRASVRVLEEEEVPASSRAQLEVRGPWEPSQSGGSTPEAWSRSWLSLSGPALGSPGRGVPSANVKQQMLDTSQSVSLLQTCRPCQPRFMFIYYSVSVECHLGGAFQTPWPSPLFTEQWLGLSHWGPLA